MSSSLGDSGIDPNCKDSGEMGVSGYLKQCMYSPTGFFFDEETEVEVKLYRLDPTTRKYALAEDYGVVKAYGAFDVKNLTTTGLEIQKSLITVKPHTEQAKKSTYCEVLAPFLRITEEQGYARMDNRTYLRGYSGQVELLWADGISLVGNSGDSIVFEGGAEDLSITWVDKNTKEVKEVYVHKGESYIFKESNIYMMNRNIPDEEFFENPTPHVKTTDRSRIKIKTAKPKSGEKIMYSTPFWGFKIIQGSTEKSMLDMIQLNSRYTLSILIILCAAFSITTTILFFTIKTHFHIKQSPLKSPLV